MGLRFTFLASTTAAAAPRTKHYHSTGYYCRHRGGGGLWWRTSFLSSVPSIASLYFLVFSERKLLSVSSFSTSPNKPQPQQSIGSRRMPSPPYRYGGASVGMGEAFELTDLGATVSRTEDARQESFDIARKLQIALVRARGSLLAAGDGNENNDSDDKKDMDTGDDDAAVPAMANAIERLDALLSESPGVVPATANRIPRENFLAHQIENVVQFRAFRHFLKTGKLLAPSSCPYATDEEYLAGACMGLCQELARYGRGRATARDILSVKMASNLVSEILDYLLQFDFRNGPLRRKYDGTKYSLRTLEMLLYELSVTGLDLAEEKTTATSSIDVEELKTDEEGGSSSLLLPTGNELKDLRERIEKRDDLRETLIKRCRDGQKAAKQSIYALHRGDGKRAGYLLQRCETIINEDLFPIVNEEPGLRFGSFANLLEEYAEGKLFCSWLNLDGGGGEKKMNDDPTVPAADATTTTTTASSSSKQQEQQQQGNDNSEAAGRLLRPDEFGVELNPAEYLGGLCDLTGEVGRYAVQRATARDAGGVRLCLQTNDSILVALQTMERLPGGVGKKLDMVRRSVEKLERILYEMSLSDATGGRNVQHVADSMDIEPTNNNNNKGTDNENNENNPDD